MAFTCTLVMCRGYPGEEGRNKMAFLYLRDCSMHLEHIGACGGGQKDGELPDSLKVVLPNDQFAEWLIH